MSTGMIQELSGDVRLVVAPNPSPLTGTGTNTYLVGTRDLAVIDPGPARPSHLESILAAVPPGGRIGYILITHPHRDHCELAGQLAGRTGARIGAFGRADAGRSPIMQALAARGLTDLAEGADPEFTPDDVLTDGAWVMGDGWRLQAIHTPGHMGAHLAFAFGDTLFSGDLVMGWSTSLVSPPDGDMGAYMASLDRLSRRPWARFLPGHGPVVDNPAIRLRELVSHRRAREMAILSALNAGPARPLALAQAIYTGTPAPLMAAASRNVLAHLIDLMERNLVQTSDFPGPEAVFSRM